MADSIWWKSGGGIVFGPGGGAILFCDHCPCAPAGECPTDCEACQDSYDVSIAGFAGACATLNGQTMTVTKLPFSPCLWYASDIREIGGVWYRMEVEIGCYQYTSDHYVWLVTVWLVDVLGGTLACNAELHSVVEDGACPAGDYIEAGGGGTGEASVA
jgi:hypothetical protein